MNAPASAEPSVELAPDISSWPGTTEAAKMVGRHPSTIKLWRTQGRIRAIQDASGCWRHNPDDLSEAVDTPELTDPGAVLAQGMSAIVAAGSSASERVLAMADKTTFGLERACEILCKQLEAAHGRIRELELERVALIEKNASTHIEELKHERAMRRLDQKHALEINAGSETSRRIESLLVLLGPIAASIGARLFGNEAVAAALDAKIAGVAPPPSAAPPPGASASSPATATGAASAPFTPNSVATSSMTLESRLTDGMARLCAAIRNLDGSVFERLRVMLPAALASALLDVRLNESDTTVGQALAAIVKAAQTLSDLQFVTLRPIVPEDIASILSELRSLLRSDSEPPTAA